MFGPTTVHGYHDCIYLGNNLIQRALHQDSRTDMDRIVDFFVDTFRNIAEWVQNTIGAIFNQNHSVTLLTDNPSYRLHYYIQPSLLKNPGSLVTALTCDGGGARGVVTLAIMKVIEERLGCHIGKAFDIKAGTSVGSINAAAISLPKEIGSQELRYSASQVLDLFKEKVSSIFSSPLWYKIQTLWGLIGPKYPSPEPIMRDIVGNLQLKDCQDSQLLIIGVDKVTGKQIYFTNLSEQSAKETFQSSVIMPSAETDICDAVLGSCAVPIGFPSKVIGNLNVEDGGVAQTNPVVAATLLALNGIAKERPLLVVSVGTGKSEFQMPTEPPTASQDGLLQGTLPLIFSLLGTNGTVSVDTMNLLATVVPNLSFIHIQPLLPSGAPIDDTSPEYLAALEDRGVQAITHYLENGGQEALIEPLKQKIQQLKSAV